MGGRETRGFTAAAALKSFADIDDLLKGTVLVPRSAHVSGLIMPLGSQIPSRPPMIRYWNDAL